MRRPLAPEERRSIAFHEAGHAAMVYWRRESLHARKIVLNADYRRGGPLASTMVPVFDFNESDLMVLIAGPLTEFLSMGIYPQKRFGTQESTAFQTATRDASETW